MQNNKAKLLGIVAIGILVIGGTGAVVIINKQEGEQPSDAAVSQQAQESRTNTDDTSSTENTQASNNYKDGSYSADGSYRTPGGTETINVDVTLKDGTVTAVSVDGNGKGDSAEYQSMFSQGISGEVVGKKIDELNISRVSGSSLTSTGFNNAINTIKREAAV